MGWRNAVTGRFYAYEDTTVAGVLYVNVTAPDGVRIGYVAVLPDPSFGSEWHRHDAAQQAARTLAAEHRLTVAYHATPELPPLPDVSTPP